MNTDARPLVHHLLAALLQVDDASIDDAHRFDQLGLVPLDLIFVVLRLENFDRGGGAFPVEELGLARTVGDLVELVDLWWQPDTLPSPVAATAS